MLLYDCEVIKGVSGRTFLSMTLKAAETFANIYGLRKLIRVTYERE